MLSLETEARITALLMKLAEGEKAIEIVRQVICGKDFDPLSAFKLLDRNSNGYLTERDFKQFLRYYKINCSNQDIKQLFLFYCVRPDNKLSLSE